MRILVAIAGLTHSQLVLKMIAQIAPLTSEPPALLQVTNRPDEEPTARATLERAVALVTSEAPHLQLRPLVRVGAAAQEIVREAIEGQYDLIVVGDRERSDVLGRIALGSTTEQVVDLAPCPVLIARGRVAPFRHVLVSNSDNHNLPLVNCLVAQLADLFRPAWDFTLLHVLGYVEGGEDRTDEEAMAVEEEQQERVREVIYRRGVQLLQRLNRPVYAKIRHGLVAEEVVAESLSGDYQLVVIGTQCGDHWRHPLLDNLAHQIIARADCPVLVACPRRG
jgi:nucleotide-binding universal stress UspA family protein